MGIRMRDAGGVLRTITQMRMRDAGSVLRTIKQVRMRDAAGVLRTVFTAISAAASPSHVSGITSGAAYSGSVTSNTTTATPTGGTAPYTYLWQFASGDISIVPSSTSTATISFTKSDCFDGDTNEAYWQCQITDANGNIVVTNQVQVTLRWVSTL